ncbi:surface protein [Phocaeicola sp. Sa1CVN1]|uniref:Surface protein n=1 Tax=Phocaeicola intestinalis TaxID=2762212 RepID=A0ABR8Y7U0_9BACT|nr:surface protein [Phocaeicola intestinalis]MBD8040234.1 surface protein [Phocaeicola intestinalis]
MRATISLDSLWQTIQSLSLNNQEWLLDKLQENIREQKEAETEYISKEEILAGIDAGLKEMKLMKEGKLQAKSFDEFLEELKHEA